MFRCYEDKLPELYTNEMLFRMLSSNSIIFKMEGVEQDFLIVYILEKIGLAFGNRNYYFNADLKRDEVKEVWLMGLRDLSFRKVMDGLYALMRGLTSYVDFPPKGYLAFRKICQDNNFGRQIEDKKEISIEVSIHSKEVASENIKKIRAMMRPMMSSILVDDNNHKMKSSLRNNNISMVN